MKTKLQIYQILTHSSDPIDDLLKYLFTDNYFVAMIGTNYEQKVRIVINYLEIHDMFHMFHLIIDKVVWKPQNAVDYAINHHSTHLYKVFKYITDWSPLVVEDILRNIMLKDDVESLTWLLEHNKISISYLYQMLDNNYMINISKYLLSIGVIHVAVIVSSGDIKYINKYADVLKNYGSNLYKYINKNTSLDSYILLTHLVPYQNLAHLNKYINSNIIFYHFNDMDLDQKVKLIPVIVQNLYLHHRLYNESDKYKQAYINMLSDIYTDNRLELWKAIPHHNCSDIVDVLQDKITMMEVTEQELYIINKIVPIQMMDKLLFYQVANNNKLISAKYASDNAKNEAMAMLMKMYDPTYKTFVKRTIRKMTDLYRCGIAMPNISEEHLNWAKQKYYFPNGSLGYHCLHGNLNDVKRYVHRVKYIKKAINNN
jgi:hypothetical protein